jgi:hypothetical protein
MSYGRASYGRISLARGTTPVTGQPAPASNIAVNPGGGALTLTGYAPTVVRGITTNAAPSAVAMVVAGYAPSVTQGLTTSVSPAAGALTVTGYVPSVSQTALKSVSPAPASLAVTGYAPTVTRGANQTIPAGAAMPSTLALTGYAPTITQAGNVMPRMADATIMRLSVLRAVVDLGPDRIQQTASLL